MLLSAAWSAWSAVMHVTHQHWSQNQQQQYPPMFGM